MRTPFLLASMALAVAAIAVLARFDQEREDREALDDLAATQSVIARILARQLSDQLQGDQALNPETLAKVASVFERPGASLALVRLPGSQLFLRSDGSSIDSKDISDAIAEGRTWVRIPGTNAPSLGLIHRTAVAGIVPVQIGPGRELTVVVATSADRERDRNHRSERRVVWAVLAAGGLVLSFGGLALLLQRKELTLQRDLALADLARERDERLQRLDRAATLGALAIGVGHEISTPLGVISGRAEQLLPRVKMDERATAAVQTIIDQTRRIDEVVRALMALARGDRGSVQQIDPARVVESAKNLVEHRFQEASVELSAGVPADLPKIHGDALLLEQALVNLLLNACEACGKGGHVSVSARGSGGYLGFQVQDDGVGISAEIAARATEPFFTTKSTAGGSGLGLAIVNEIVANHGGRLVIEPRDPKGTAATMEIPIDRSTGERHG